MRHAVVLDFHGPGSWAEPNATCPNLPSWLRFGGERSRRLCADGLARRSNRRFAARFPAQLWEAMLPFRFRQSKVLDALRPGREAEWRNEHERIDAIEPLLVKRLSFFHDPDGVLELLDRLVEADATVREAYLDFDMTEIEDLGPFLVLSEIWGDFCEAMKVRTVPTTVRRILEGTELARGLQLPVPRDRGQLPDDARILAFPKDRRHDANTSTSSQRQADVPRRDKVAPRLASRINTWVQTVTEDGDDHCEFSGTGEQALIMMITELLDNAERHSEPDTRDGGWSIAACMTRADGDAPDNLKVECHLAFLSIGASFADSLSRAGPKSRAIIDDYLAQQAIDGSVSRDTLMTLLALQDWVSCDAEAERDDRLAGQGLMYVLQFVNTLGGGCPDGDEPRVAIVSGNSYIQCRVPYVEPIEQEDSRRRTLWFNPANDPAVAPDVRFVHDLRSRFPGTVISVKFSMNATHLRKLADNVDHDDPHDQ